MIANKETKKTVDKMIKAESFNLITVEHNIENTFQSNVIKCSTFFDTDVLYCEYYRRKIECIYELIKRKKITEQMGDMFIKNKLKAFIVNSLIKIPEDVCNVICDYAFDEKDYNYKFITSSIHDVLKDLYSENFIESTLIVVNKINIKLWKWIIGDKLKIFYISSTNDIKKFERTIDLNNYDAIITTHTVFRVLYTYQYRWSRFVIETPLCIKRKKIKLPSANFTWLLGDLDSPFYIASACDIQPNFLSNTIDIFVTDYKKRDPCELLKPFNKRIFYSEAIKEMLKCRIDNSILRQNCMLKNTYNPRRQVNKVKK